MSIKCYEKKHRNLWEKNIEMSEHRKSIKTEKKSMNYEKSIKHRIYGKT